MPQKWMKKIGANQYPQKKQKITDRHLNKEYLLHNINIYYWINWLWLSSHPFLFLFIFLFSRQSSFENDECVTNEFPHPSQYLFRKLYKQTLTTAINAIESIFHFCPLAVFHDLHSAVNSQSFLHWFLHLLVARHFCRFSIGQHQFLIPLTPNILNNREDRLTYAYINFKLKVMIRPTS